MLRFYSRSRQRSQKKKMVKFQCSFIRKRKLKTIAGNERHEFYFPYIQFISEILLNGLCGQVIDIWDKLFHCNLTEQLLPSTSENSNSLLSLLLCPSLRLRAAPKPSPDRQCATSNGRFGTISTVFPCHRQSRTTLNHNRECLYKPWTEICNIFSRVTWPPNFPFYIILFSFGEVGGRFEDPTSKTPLLLTKTQNT